MASDILTLQEYLFKGLLSCDLFARFNVVLERDFLAESEVEFDSIWLTPRTENGAMGIGLLVEMPRLDIPKPNSLQRQLVASIAVIEERNINMTKDVGTQVSAEELGEMALDFMFGWLLGLSSGLTPEAGALKPAPDVVEGPGLVVYRAAVGLRREHHAVDRCDVPTISGDGPYVLANGDKTPDAEIYYTLDGSFPGSANEAAVLYEGPVAIQAGQTITFAAWRADRLPSHVSVKTIS